MGYIIAAANLRAYMYGIKGKYLCFVVVCDSSLWRIWLVTGRTLVWQMFVIVVWNDRSKSIVCVWHLLRYERSVYLDAVRILFALVLSTNNGPWEDFGSRIGWDLPRNLITNHCKIFFFYCWLFRDRIACVRVAFQVQVNVVWVITFLRWPFC